MILSYLTIMVVVGCTAAIVAGNKGRSGIGWFILCFLMPIAILPLLALRQVARPEADRRLSPPA
jgi:hypothetical protein